MRMQNELEPDYEEITRLENEIRNCTFAVQDTALYLNSHPNDLMVLAKHNEYADMLHQLYVEYGKYNRPLMNILPAQGYWTYVNDPWPFKG